MTVITAKAIQSMSQKQRDEFLKANNNLGIANEKYHSLHASMLAKYLASDQKLRATIESINKDSASVITAMEALFTEETFQNSDFLNSLASKLEQLISNYKYGESAESLSEDDAKLLKEKMSNLGLEVNEKTDTHALINLLTTYINKNSISEEAYQAAVGKVSLPEGISLDDALKYSMHVRIVEKAKGIAPKLGAHKSLSETVAGVELDAAESTDATKATARWNVAKTLFADDLKEIATYDGLASTVEGSEATNENIALKEKIDSIDLGAIARHLTSNELENEVVKDLVKHANAMGLSEDFKKDFSKFFVSQSAPSKVSEIESYISSIIDSEILDTTSLANVKMFKEMYSPFYTDDAFSKLPENISNETMKDVKFVEAAFKKFRDTMLAPLEEGKVQLESAQRSELKDKYSSLTADKVLPKFILINSTKFVSLVSVSDNLANVNVIFNLCAPAAFSFDVPVALSNKVPSSSGVTKSSVIVNPTL